MVYIYRFADVKPYQLLSSQHRPLRYLAHKFVIIPLARVRARILTPTGLGRTTSCLCRAPSPILSSQPSLPSTLVMVLRGHRQLLGGSLVAKAGDLRKVFCPNTFMLPKFPTGCTPCLTTLQCEATKAENVTSEGSPIYCHALSLTWRLFYHHHLPGRYSVEALCTII